MDLPISFIVVCFHRRKFRRGSCFIVFFETSWLQMVIFHRFLLPFTRPGNPQNPWGRWNPGSPTGGLWKIGTHHILGKHISGCNSRYKCFCIQPWYTYYIIIYIYGPPSPNFWRIGCHGCGTSRGQSQCMAPSLASGKVGENFIWHLAEIPISGWENRRQHQKTHL